MRNWKFLLACGLLGVSILPAQTGIPSINSGGVVNAADYTAALAHGSIFSVWGANLAASTAKAPGVPLPTTLDGVTVEVVDGSRVIAAPLFFVSAGQINAQLPFEVTSASVGVRVKNARGTSNTQTISVTARAPRLFTRTLDGRGEAIVTHADYSIVEAAKPAAPNEVVLVFLTGLGQTSPLATSGKAAGDNATNGPLNWVREEVTVTVAGQAGMVHFSGLAPGFVGLYQLNVQLPASLPGGAQPLVVSCGGQSSQASVTVAIRSVSPIATVNLGSGGGRAQAGGATIDVPAGLLTGSGTVSIYKAEPEATATSRLTSVYAVEGLPTLPTAPVTLTAELKRPPDAGKTTFLLWRWHVDRERSREFDDPAGHGGWDQSDRHTARLDILEFDQNRERLEGGYGFLLRRVPVCGGLALRVPREGQFRDLGSLRRSRHFRAGLRTRRATRECQDEAARLTWDWTSAAARSGPSRFTYTTSTRGRLTRSG